MQTSTTAPLLRCLATPRARLFHHRASAAAKQNQHAPSPSSSNGQPPASRGKAVNESKRTTTSRREPRKLPSSQASTKPPSTKNPFKLLERLNSTRRDLRPSALSLLEELFPVETANSRRLQLNRRDAASAQQEKPGQDVPWIPFDTNLDSNKLAAVQNNELSRRKAAARDLEEDSVLVLRKASVHLSEADFQRVVPTGRHIEGWNRGSFTRIIKGRNPATLRPNGTYYLVFPTLEAAQAYQHNAESLHEFNKRFDLSARDAPIPPPPVLLDDGKRLEEPLTRFTLCLPSQDLSLELVRQPFKPDLRRIVEEGFVDRHHTDSSEHEHIEHRVLVDFECDKPVSYFLVRGAVQKDGDRRNMQWALAGAQGGIRWINLPQAQRRAPLLRFVLSFVDESEARRFCMEWHRRDISQLLGAVVTADSEAWHDDGPVIANAEYIW